MNTHTNPLPDKFLHQLHESVQRVESDPADCWAYGYDNSRNHHPPQVVVFPTSHSECESIVRLCHQFGIPIVARGRGTGTCGGAVPLLGGVVLSTEKMNRILSVDPVNRIVVTQPGVTNQAIQEAASKHGLFWPPDPTSSANCTIGGNIAFNSAGPHAVKYGTTRDNTLALRGITGDGDSFRCGVKTSKGVVGYDLTRLLIGSEGTLAVITEATLKLTPLPESRRTLQAIFRDIHSAAEAVAQAMTLPDTPSALEFMDHNAIEMIRGHSQATLPQQAGALLMIEVDGSAQLMAQAIDTIHSAMSNEGLIEFKVAENDNEAAALWATRKALSPALRTIAPKKINEDVVVPVSNIPALISDLDRLAKEFGITIVNFGHAGNGNIHVNLLVDPNNSSQMTNADLCLQQIFQRVLALDGTISGEHGVGIEKLPFVGLELDAVSLRLMRAIKQQFDPKGILNPGKTLPEPGQ